MLIAHVFVFPTCKHYNITKETEKNRQHKRHHYLNIIIIITLSQGKLMINHFLTIIIIIKHVLAIIIFGIITTTKAMQMQYFIITM